MAPNLPYPIRLNPLTDSQVTRVGVKSPEDVVVVAAVRTAMTKGRKGGLKNTLADGKENWLVEYMYISVLSRTYHIQSSCVTFSRVLSIAPALIPSSSKIFALAT